jgi:hypothetical protein
MNEKYTIEKQGVVIGEISEAELLSLHFLDCQGLGYLNVIFNENQTEVITVSVILKTFIQ